MDPSDVCGASPLRLALCSAGVKFCEHDHVEHDGGEFPSSGSTASRPSLAPPGRLHEESEAAETERRAGNFALHSSNSTTTTVTTPTTTASRRRQQLQQCTVVTTHGKWPPLWAAGALSGCEQNVSGKDGDRDGKGGCEKERSDGNDARRLSSFSQGLLNRRSRVVGRVRKGTTEIGEEDDEEEREEDKEVVAAATEERSDRYCEMDNDHGRGVNGRCRSGDDDVVGGSTAECIGRRSTTGKENKGRQIKRRRSDTQPPTKLQEEKLLSVSSSSTALTNKGDDHHGNDDDDNGDNQKSTGPLMMGEDSWKVLETEARAEVVTLLWLEACHRVSEVRPAAECEAVFRPQPWSIQKFPGIFVPPTGTEDEDRQRAQRRRVVGGGMPGAAAIGSKAFAVAVTGFVGAERSGWEQLILAMGAEMCKSLRKRVTTHLVCKEVSF